MHALDQLRERIPELPQSYVRELATAAPWERDFVDPDRVYCFFLWSAEEALELQPDSESYPELVDYLAIGSDGGGETFLLRIPDGSVWVADMIDPSGSMARIAETFEAVLAMVAPGPVRPTERPND